MSNKKKDSASPVWRECYDITESGRLFVSSSGEVKFSLTTHHDEKTGRPYVLIDGRPIFIDSLSLSMFGDASRPRRCYDITHIDGNPDNCSPDNLEWTSTRLRDVHRAPLSVSPTNLSYIMQRTVTPEMVSSHSYPIVNPVPAVEYSVFDADLNQDVYSTGGTASSPQKSSPESVTSAELAQRVSDLEDKLSKRPRDNDERMRELARLIAEDIIGINPHIRYISTLKKHEMNTEKYLCKLDVPYGYTVVRRKENGRWIWYRVNEEVLSFIESVFSDVRSGKKPKDLLDIRTIRWRPYGKAEYEYLGDYIFDGNEISEEEFGLSDDRMGFDTERNDAEMMSGRPEVTDFDKTGENPVNIRSDMKRNFEYEDDKGTSAQDKQGDKTESCENVRDTSADEGSMNISRDEKQALVDIVTDMSGYDMRIDDVREIRDEKVMDIIDDCSGKIRTVNNRNCIDDGLTIEQIDEISDKLKQMTPGELNDIRQLRGDVVENERGGRGKPVIVTDMRNLREFYCSSITECAELLGTTTWKVGLAIRGKIRQIGNYQISLKNNADGILILQGIYKKYMDMLEKKRQELVGKDEEKKLEEELDDINSEIERMMSERGV